MAPALRDLSAAQIKSWTDWLAHNKTIGALKGALARAEKDVLKGALDAGVRVQALKAAIEKNMLT